MRRRAAVTGIALVVATTGCGGGAKVAGPSPTPSIRSASTKPATNKAAAVAAKAAIAKAVKAYSGDLVAGKGTKAYPLLSAHCRAVITASAFNALALQAHATYPKAKLRKITVTDVKGAQAHVTYTYTQAVLNQTRQSWVKEHGGWRWNGC